MNVSEFERRNNLTIMATSTSIAKKAAQGRGGFCHLAYDGEARRFR